MPNYFYPKGDVPGTPLAFVLDLNFQHSMSDADVRLGRLERVAAECAREGWAQWNAHNAKWQISDYGKQVLRDMAADNLLPDGLLNSAMKKTTARPREKGYRKAVIVCKYPECDGGPAAGYCRDECRNAISE